MCAFSINSTSWAAVLAVVLVITAAPARGQEVSYTGSLQYATGDYIFSERTSSVYLFNGFSVSAKRVNARISVPLIFQNSPWVSYSGVGVVPSGGPQQGSVNERGQGGRGQGQTVVLVDTTSYSEVGLGDPTMYADVELRADRGGWPAVRLATGVKLPLASVDRGFGTGAWDFGGGLSLSKQLGRRFVFVDVMYWRLGDMTDLELKNPISYSVAFGQALMNGKLGVLASLSGYTEIISGLDPPTQLGLGLTHQLSDGHGLSGSASFGLTESMPDFSLSFGWRVGL